MNYILFDDSSWTNLLPLTYTKPIAELRIGILTIKQKWDNYLSVKSSYLTQDYLSKKYPLKQNENNLYINSTVLPNENIIAEISQLKQNEGLKTNDNIVAIRTQEVSLSDITDNNFENIRFIESKSKYNEVNYPWDIFQLNGEEIASDFKLLTKGRTSASISETNNIIDSENIFIEEGAKVEFATLNPDGGFIYIGKDAEIMEGTVVRGSLALCNNSIIKLSAKIYGPTTIGPHSRAGGEINNSVISGYSNKGHDGFLGNSVLGEWCNIGADTNVSNLKNNYAEVKVWNYKTEKFKRTGLQFCGLIMGDHSKCGINTMFNTGTVVGVNTNIYGSGFPRNFIPSFSWGSTQKFTTYSLTNAFEVCERVMERRHINFDETEKDILLKIFDLTQKYRRF